MPSHWTRSQRAAPCAVSTSAMPRSATYTEVTRAISAQKARATALRGLWVTMYTSSENATTFAEHARLRLLLQVLDRNPVQAQRFTACLRSILHDNDAR